MQSIAPTQLVFDDPRLHMTVFGRILVRVVSYVARLVTLVAAVDFTLSDIPWIKWLGIFLILFLLDQLFHFGEGDRPLTELSSNSGSIKVPHRTSIASSPDDARSGVGLTRAINLAPYLTEKSFTA